MYKYVLIFIILLIILSLVTLTAAIINKNNNTVYYSNIMQQDLVIIKPPVLYERNNINEFIHNNPKHKEFYDKYTKNSEITTKIIDHAIDRNVPIHIAFSIVWNESRYKVTAIGPKNPNGTRDWGLFQLNDGYRKGWTEEDFFNIDKNIKAGIEYLAYCISATGSLEKGIGAYNKGVKGISKYGLPEKYISDILIYEKKLDNALNNYLYN